MSLLPPASSRVSNDEGFPTGSLVIYQHNNSPLLAVVLEEKRSKYKVLNQRGREAEIPANRLYRLPGKIEQSASNTDERLASLEHIYAEATSLVSEIDLEEIWLSITDGANSNSMPEVNLAQISELYFGDNKTTQHLAVKLALLQDRVFFKRKKFAFQARPPETVEELKKAAEAERLRAEARARLLAQFKERLSDSAFEFSDETLQQIKLLEDLAANACEGANSKAARELLNFCFEELKIELHGTPEKKAYHLLCKLDHFGADTDITIVRYKPCSHFSASVLEKAGELESFTAPESLKRQDLSAVFTITIDDHTTLDMDDAISLEKTTQGYRLGIHITDVASAFEAGTDLDLEAKQRGTSVYTPTTTFNMLPEALSNNTLSLIEGKSRACLSYIFEIDSEYNIKTSSIVPTLIQVDQRLNYDQVDQILENGQCESIELSDSLLNIYQIAAQHELNRIDNGAIKVNRKDVAVLVDQESNVTTKELDEGSPARSLIGELMILANQVSADYAFKHELPVLYRSQPEPDQDPFDVPEHIPPGPAYDYAIRSKLKRSASALTPEPHSSLGLKRYIQVTSPIRRYLDLCNQRQLVEHLKSGRAQYDKQAYQNIVNETELPLSNARALSRDSKRFWLMKYLRNRRKSDPFIAGTVIRNDLKNPLVELEEIYMTTTVKFAKTPNLGDRIKFKLKEVDPVFDYLGLEVVGPHNPS